MVLAEILKLTTLSKLRTTKAPEEKKNGSTGVSRQNAARIPRISNPIRSVSGKTRAKSSANVYFRGEFPDLAKRVPVLHKTRPEAYSLQYDLTLISSSLSRNVGHSQGLQRTWFKCGIKWRCMVIKQRMRRDTEFVAVVSYQRTNYRYAVMLVP